MNVIVDAGPLIAWANRRDRQHAKIVELLESFADGDFIIPVLCLAEACHITAERAGPLAEVALVQRVLRTTVEGPTTADLYRMAELMEQHADWPLGAADASIVALAERWHTDTIITFDRRHFSAVRPRHVEAFRVLPA